MNKSKQDPAEFDFLILGGPIYYYKLWNRKWVLRNWPKIKEKPIILFTVSGAPPGPKLNQWLIESFPQEMVLQMRHVALRGRQNPNQLNWFDRIALKFAARHNPDPQVAKEELEGFNYMDKSSIKPIIELVHEFNNVGLPQ